MIVNRTLLRYAAFALGPPYTVALLVGTTVERAGGLAMTVAVLIGVFQICYLRVHETYRTLRYNHTAMRMPTVVTEVVLAVGALAVAVLGGLGPGPAGFVVPPVDELFKSLWGTIFVAVVAAIVIAKTRVQLDIGRLVQRSRQEVGPRLQKFARTEAVKAGADPNLVETILLTENLQRPEWFRQLERIKGRLFPRGSYGVMQVSSDKPISDEDSIIKAVDEHLHGSRVTIGSHGGPDYESLRKTLTAYNSDKVFVDLAIKIFWQVQLSNRSAAVPNGTTSPRTAPAQSGGPAGGTSSATAVKTTDGDVDTKRRAELIGQTARLCMLAVASLSTAQNDELSSISLSLTAFLRAQTGRQPPPTS